MYEFDADLWLWNEHKGSWHFLTLPDDVSDDIEARTSGNTAGFGSVKVEVTIGATTWQTSVFPDAKRGAYVLPVKKAVRSAEGLGEGSLAAVRLRVVDG